MSKRVEIIIGDYPNQISLDLETNAISIALQYSIDDVRNIDKKNTNYSKTITLPGTKKNNLAFGNLFDVNSAFEQFNPNLKTKARILVDSSPVLEGYLQLRGVKKLNNADLQGNKISYQAVVFDDSIDFMRAIGDKLVSDLDFSDYDHVYNGTNIANAWSNHTYEDVYQYPLLDKNTEGYVTTDFKPCFYHKALLLEIAKRAGDKIDEDGNVIEGEGYKLEGSFIESNDDVDSNASRYEKEIIGWDGNTPKVPESDAIAREFRVGLTTAQTTLATAIKQGRTQPWRFLYLKGPANFNSEVEADGFFDNGDNCVGDVAIDGALGGTYTSPKTGKYSFRIRQNFEIDYTAAEACIKANSSESVFIDAIPKIRAFLRYEDTNEQVPGASSSVDFGEFENFSSAGTQTIGPGDRVFTFTNIRVEKDRAIYVEYDMTCETFGWYPNEDRDYIVPVTVDFKINNSDTSGTNLSLWENTTVRENNIQDGDDVEINQYLPSKIKQKDIITDLIKRYNLYIVKDPLKPRTLLLQTRDTYYKDNVTTLDWTQKKDFSSEDDVKFLSDLQNKEILFTYKPHASLLAADGVKYNQDYTKSTGDIYGQKKISFENEFVSGVKKIQSIFSTAPLKYRGDVNNHVVVPTIRTSEGNRQPCLLYWGGMVPVQDENGESSSLKITWGEDTSPSSYTGYPYAGHYDNPYDITYDIHYGEVTAEYFPIAVNTITDNNLFNRHWRNYYNQISIGKLVTSFFYLKETDISFIKNNLNSRIFVKDSYYHINKIVDYKPLENGLTKVELLRIQPVKKFIPQPSTPYTIESGIEVFYVAADDDDTAVPTVGPFRSSITNEVNSTNVMTLGLRNYVATGSSGVINGDDNVIGGNSRNINITGNRNVVDPGLENVTIVGNDITVTESNTSIINGNTFNAPIITERIEHEIEIGDWDMDTATNISVAHELSATEWLTIRNVEVSIRNDADTTLQPLTNSGLLAVGNVGFSLQRETSGTFDSAAYTATSYNRGFITFWYKPD